MIMASKPALVLLVQLAIRADEANHRDVNHTFAALSENDTNPYVLKYSAGVKAEPEGKKAAPQQQH